MKATFERDGVWFRYCSECDETKPLAEEFYVNRRDENSEIVSRSHSCKACTRARAKRHHEKIRADPVAWQRRLEQIRETNRRWRMTQPEQYRAARHRYKEKIRADPARNVEHLEVRRMDHRLKLEREGRQARSTPRHARKLPDRLPTLPADRLAVFLDAEARRRDVSLETLALELRFDTRRLRDWREPGARVQFDVADRIMTTAGEFMWTVWPELAEEAA